MAPSVVLVTGVSRFLGGHLAARLAANPDIDRVLGVDTVPPPRDLLRRMGRAEFVRADIRNPLIAKVISQAAVDTVVHASLSANPGSSGRAHGDEGDERHRHHAAARRLPEGADGAAAGAEVDDRGVRVQLARPGDLQRVDDAQGPALAAATPRTPPRSRATCAGSPAAGRTSRSPCCASPTSSARASTPCSPATSRCPWCPPCSATTRGCSCCTRRTGWPSWSGRPARTCPGCSTWPPTACCCSRRPSAAPAGSRCRCPRVAVGPLGRLLRGARLVDFSPEQMRLLNFGRVVDNTRLREQFGFTPRWTTTQAFDDYVRGRALRPVLGPGPVRGARARGAGRGPGAAVTARPRKGRPGSGRGGSPRSPTRRSSRCTPTSPADAPGGGSVIPLHADDPGEPRGAAAASAGRRPPTPAAGRRRWRAEPEQAPAPDEEPGPGLGAGAGRAAGLPAPPAAGDYPVDDFGFDPDLTDNVLLPALRPLYRGGSGSRRSACTTCPATGGALVVANHSGTLPLDSLMTVGRAARRPPAATAPAHAGRRPDVPAAGARRAGPQAGRHAGLQPGRRAAAVRRRAGRGLAGGLQGHRQAVPGPLQAAALRPRRLRLGRAAHRRADHPVLDRRGRGDLPEDRRPQAAGAAARRPVLPGDADCSRCSGRSG